MSKELKPCPFCGGTHSINVINFFTRDNARKCDICGAEAPEAKTPEEAAEKWNTRPAEDALKAALRDISMIGFEGKIGDTVAREMMRRIANAAIAEKGGEDE